MPASASRRRTKACSSRSTTTSSSTDGIPKELVQSHWVGFTAYSTVLAWNKEVYKDNPPKSWADFLDVEKFPGTRALCGYGADRQCRDRAAWRTA